MRGIFRAIRAILKPILKLVAIIVIAAFIISWGAFIFSGYVLTPWIPAFSPEPVVSGYLGFFSGVISLGFIPLLILLALLFKVIAGYRMSPSLKRATLGVWSVTLLAFVATMIFSAKNYVNHYKFEETLLTSDISSEEPLLIKVDERPRNNKMSVSLDDMRITRDEIILFNKRYRISPTDDTELSLIRESSSSGSSRRDAQRALLSEKSLYDSSDNQFNLSKYSTLTGGEKFRRQRYRYDLQIPIGTKVTFESRDGDAYLGRKEYENGEIWEMTADGLVKVG